MAVIMLKMMVFTMLPFVFDYFVNKNLMFHVVSPKRNFFYFFIFYFFIFLQICLTLAKRCFIHVIALLYTIMHVLIL